MSLRGIKLPLAALQEGKEGEANGNGKDQPSRPSLASYFSESNIHKEIKITFTLPGGEVLEEVVNSGETVQEIKRKLCSASKIPSNSMFFFNGVDMLDPLSLNDIPGVTGNSSLQITVKVRGQTTPADVIKRETTSGPDARRDDTTHTTKHSTPPATPTHNTNVSTPSTPSNDVSILPTPTSTNHNISTSTPTHSPKVPALSLTPNSTRSKVPSLSLTPTLTHNKATDKSEHHTDNKQPNTDKDTHTSIHTQHTRENSHMYNTENGRDEKSTTSPQNPPTPPDTPKKGPPDSSKTGQDPPDIPKTVQNDSPGTKILNFVQPAPPSSSSPSSPDTALSTIPSLPHAAFDEGEPAIPNSGHEKPKSGHTSETKIDVVDDESSNHEKRQIQTLGGGKRWFCQVV